ncbi:TerB family tellurite resistance protein [Tepidamorphus sp. 3E244]|uniref:tellurite resistance TerB family protein n=1 Tax=Tepidamorphus sp. 3E244 TaxID=3385498 RepID=UPI0038FC5ECB
MPLFKSIARFIDELSGAEEDETASYSPDDEKLAAAALAFHVIAVDGIVEDREKDTMRQVLAEQFDLDEKRTEELVEAARQRSLESVDLYAFTSVLNRKLDDEGRGRVVEMLWEMVYADGTVHEFEDNALWRIAELLHVSSRERIRLRKRVERDHGSE